MNWLTSVAAVALLALAGWWSVRLARADAAFRQRTASGIERAAALLPTPEYLVARATQLDYDGGDPVPLLERAAAASPRWSAPRIQLGLEAESHGDLAPAEKWLLEAARIDHQFEPAWTLANFYFRRADTEKFWHWIHTALGVSYGDRRLAFDLCWQVTSDASEILKRAIPDPRDVVSAYLGYLLWVRPTPDAIAPVATKLAGWHDAQDTPVLLAAADSLIAAHRIADAADVWSAAGEPRPSGITHPDFEAHTGHGFDWRWSDAPGVSHIPEDGALRLEFSGRESETSELLRQTVQVQPGTYLLRWESRTQGVPANTGFTWIAGSTSAEIAATSEWTAGKAQLAVVGDSIDLVLEYRKPAGEPRAQGGLELRHVRITLQ